ncbi:hypothetical protein N0V82_008307 [Gnomoniopsis sp. IMI 355080]|nr:hypothetical protein N0V82_008307 [Gnomoniopsis sp. IMI 355080]
MRSQALFVSTLLSATALAAPAPKSMMAAVPEWTITSMEKTCNADDTTCTWTFGINNGTGTTPCTEVVTGAPASQTNGGPVDCGVYKVTSGWSGQFGPGQGFTTFAVVNYPANLIVYPAYTDTEAANATVVTPDKSYAPQALS